MAGQDSLLPDGPPSDGNGSGSEDSWTFLDDDDAPHDDIEHQIDSDNVIHVANEAIEEQPQCDKQPDEVQSNGDDAVADSDDNEKPTTSKIALNEEENAPQVSTQIER